MERLSKYYLSCSLLLLLFNSCQEQRVIYQKVFSEAQKTEMADQFVNAAGTDIYYQGSVAERMLILEAQKFTPENGDVYRELGVPYLKRGFAAEAYFYYQKASELKPEIWLGYMAYCWLYFYRDYELALEAIDQYDDLTPDFVDYPQATSVDYMRGICYLQLGQYGQAIKYLQKHFEKEEEEIGSEYIEVMTYLALGIAYHRAGKLAKAQEIYQLGLEHNKTTADLWFHYAQLCHDTNNLTEKSKALAEAQIWLDSGSKNLRPYVEEFFAIYQEDIDNMRMQVQGGNYLK